MQLKSARKSARKSAPVATAESAILASVPAILPGMPVASAIDAQAPATDAPSEIAYKSASRDAQTVQAGATLFALESNRDSSYLIFFGSVMRRAGNNDSATLAQIHAAGVPRNGSPHLRDNPHYTGSSKATDGGAINRAIAAGYFTKSESGNRLTATDKAKASALYNKIPVTA